MFSKIATASLIALLSLSTISATVILTKRANFDFPVNCDFVLTPDTAVDPSTNFDAEFNFVIGFSLSDQTGGEIFQFGSSDTSNTDGTFSVTDEIAADGLSAADTSDIITGWLGETKRGIATNWVVDSVSCAAA